jgi:signal transduction histidine kinase/ActR/RegA family two-component response regulator
MPQTEGSDRALDLYRTHRDHIFRRTDVMFARLMCAQWLVAIVLAIFWTPYTYAGASRSVHPHVLAAVILGGTITSLPLMLAHARPGWIATRHVIAVAQMLWSALLIHLSGGRVETHFHVFGSLTFLAFYRDWRVLLPASLVVVIDHVVRQILWPESVYGVSSVEWWRFLEHGFWVVFIDTFLIAACVSSDREMREIARRQAEIESLSASIAAMNAQLEARVEERTAALETANRELGASLNELRETKDKLILADKLMAIGQLSAGIAHEINNPLSYALSNMSFVDSALKSNAQVAPEQREEIESALHDGLEGLDRVRRIVASLKVFARTTEERRELVDLHKVIESTVAIAANEIRYRGRLVLDLQHVPKVTADSGRIGQVVLNLVINAAQALTVQRAEGNEVRVRTSTDERGRAIIEVSDTGHGVAPEYRARLFDPFFTTKAVGVGSGLGLSICHGIVAGLGGEIELESEVGKGTCFRVILPPATAAHQLHTSGPSARSRPSSRRRVLVIDDEPLVLKALERGISAHHDVESMLDADLALKKIREGVRYDVILCDLMMPQKNGVETHAELERIDSDQARRLIFITGGAFTSELETAMGGLTRPCITKPFATEEILSNIERVASEAVIRR